MKEYWINVYEGGKQNRYVEKRYADFEGALHRPNGVGYPIYRIHVIMNGGYNKLGRKEGRKLLELLPHIYS